MTTAYDVTVTRDDNLWADLTDLDDRLLVHVAINISSSNAPWPWVESACAVS